MASFMFLKAKTLLWDAGIDWEADVFRAMPVDAVPDPDTDDFVDDIEGDEVDSVRETLTCARVEDAANDQLELDVTDFSFTGPDDGTMVGFVIYKQVGGDDSTPENDPVILFLDTDDIVSNGGDIDVTIDAEGVAKF